MKGGVYVRSTFVSLCARLVLAVVCWFSLSSALAQAQYNYSDNRLKMTSTGVPGEYKIERVDPSVNGASKSINTISAAANDSFYNSAIKVEIEGRSLDLNLKQTISNALIGRSLARLAAYFSPALGWATAAVDVLRTLYDIYRKENNDLALSPNLQLKFHQNKIKNVSFLYEQCTKPVMSKGGWFDGDYWESEWTGDCDDWSSAVWSERIILDMAKDRGCKTGYVLSTGYVIECQVIKQGGQAYVYGYWPNFGVRAMPAYEYCGNPATCGNPNYGILNSSTYEFPTYNVKNIQTETWTVAQSKVYDDSPFAQDKINALPTATETEINNRIDQRVNQITDNNLEVQSSVINDALKYGSDTRIKIDFNPQGYPLTYGATDLDLGTSTFYEVDANGKAQQVRLTRTAKMEYYGQFVNIRINTLRLVNGVSTNEIFYAVDVKPKLEDQPKLVDCDKYPNTTGCSGFGEVVNETVKSTSFAFSLLRKNFASDATCPPPVRSSFTMFGRSIPSGFSYEPLCKFAGMVRGVVLLLAAVLSAHIFIGMFKV